MAGKARRRKAALDVEVVSDAAEAAALRADWDRLAAAAATGPAMTPALALSWWEHLGRGSLALVIARTAGGEVVALAPLHRRAGVGGRTWRWLGHGTGVVGEVIADPADPRDGPGAIVDRLGELGARLHLLEARPEGGGVQELRRSGRWRTDARVRDRCPVLDLAGVNSLDALLSDRRNLRHLLSRSERRAADAGGWTVEAAATPAEVRRVLDAVRAVYDEAERNRPRWHVLAGDLAPFGRAVLERAAASEQVLVLVGRVGGRPVAFDVWIRCGQRMSAWIGRFDPAYAEFTPGHLLVGEAVRRGISDGVRLLDLQIGDSDYKRRWANGGYDTYEIVATGPAAGQLAVLRAGSHATERLAGLRASLRRVSAAEPARGDGRDLREPRGGAALEHDGRLVLGPARRSTAQPQGEPGG
ncbi:MAG: GNAT family N-acetyltransferase [Acidimicrobiia bacterium]|nr:GNAT family N-acetyltransferase [Acidimicrobiia bacterium]